MEPTPYEAIEAQLVASQAREKLLQDQVFDLLAHIRQVEAEHNLPQFAFYPVSP
jgi:hypothetical protein